MYLLTALWYGLKAQECSKAAKPGENIMLEDDRIEGDSLCEVLSVLPIVSGTNCILISPHCFFQGLQRKMVDKVEEKTPWVTFILQNLHRGSRVEYLLRPLAIASSPETGRLS